MHNSERCAVHVMPLYFNHKVYASWVRGINACGFHKVPGREHRWFHADFHRDHPERLESIKRRPPPSRGRPGGSESRASRRPKAAVKEEEEEPAASTAIVPHVPLSVADLHPERLQLQQAMAEEAHLERAVAQIREEDFWQRFEAVRMVHMMLTHHAWQQSIDAARKANPTITVLQPAPDDTTCPLLQLCERTSTLQLCDNSAEEDKAMVEDQTADAVCEADLQEASEMKIEDEVEVMARPLVVSSDEVQRLLDEHGLCHECEEETRCDQDCETGTEDTKEIACDPANDVEMLQLPTLVPLPVERCNSSSSAATVDLPEATEQETENVLDRRRAPLPTPPLPPTLADLPMPAPLPEAPPLKSLAPVSRGAAATKQARTAMVPSMPCGLEASMRRLPSLLPDLLPCSSADIVCGSAACPLSRYGAHTHKTCDSLPKVGSAERKHLEEYVDRCFSTMASSLGSLGQSLVPCA